MKEMKSLKNQSSATIDLPEMTASILLMPHANCVRTGQHYNVRMWTEIRPPYPIFIPHMLSIQLEKNVVNYSVLHHWD